MKVKKIIFSTLALLNVIFVPVFDVWGGLFPENVEYDFFDVIEYAFEGNFEYWVVLFTISIFIPGLFMLIFSFSDNVAMFKLSAGAGILAEVFTLIRYIAQYDIDYLLDFEYGSISIGTWIALLLFIIAFIAVKKPKKAQFAPEPKIINDANDTSNFVPVNSAPKKKFCSQCGTEISASTSFCGNCGHKIK